MNRRVLAMMAMACALGPTARAQVKLEYRPTEGETKRSRTTSKTHQIMTVAGMDIQTDSEEVSVSRAAAGARKADGTLPIEMTIESARIAMTIAGMDFSFGTDDENAKVDLPGLDFLPELFKVLKGASYTVVLDAANKVKFVEGVEKNLTKVADLKPATAAALKSRFDAERIKHAFEQALTQRPEGLVREGETWDRTEANEIGGGQTLTFTRRYEYKGTVEKDGKTLDKIGIRAIDVVYKQDPNAESPAKITKSDLKVASSEGTMLLDRKEGTPVERKEKTQLKGTMSMTINGMDLDVVLDLTLDVTSALEPAAK